MIPRIKEIEALNNYKLRVTFDDDVAVIYDVEEDINIIPQFQPLKSEYGLFKNFQLDESRTCIFWSDQIDLASDTVREYGERVKKEDGCLAGKETDMEDCIFCMLANGQIPTDMVYQDDKIAVFRDADPQAPVHVLMVPKIHITSLDDLTDEHAELMSHMMLKIKEIAAQEGLENGYRCVINTGEDGQQSVKHLHIHILGKRSMQWPPG